MILQHPREKDMPIGTARMATLCLPQAKLHVGVRWEDSEEFRAAVSDPSHPPILLYPGPEARDVLADPPEGPVTLIVVDGTWSQAKNVVRDNAVLASIPRYAFRAPEPSNYRIRREPKVEYVSTIEALMHVLGALEGDPERFRSLLVPFNAMIDAHIAKQATAPRVARFHRPSQRRVAAPAVIPPSILGRPDDVVLLSVEANAWPYKDPSAPPDEPVHVVARRLGTGETFAMIAAPRNALAPGTPTHAEIDAATLLAGSPREDVIAAFQRFLRPGDALCSWGWHSQKLLTAAGATLPAERHDLRSVARILARRAKPPAANIGSVEDYGARFVAPGGAAPAAPPTTGRAGRRIELLTRIVSGWRAAQ